MKNSKWLFLCIFALFPLMTAMSAFQGPNPERIPLPEKKFIATFVDLTNLMTDCRNVSIEGETFLEGKRGNGTVTIPFDIISEISITPDGEQLKGTVKLKDGNSVSLMLSKTHRAYGHTTYGTYQIKLSDLRKMMLSK